MVGLHKLRVSGSAVKHMEQDCIVRICQQGRNDPSQSLQMIARPLMTPDEIKALKRNIYCDEDRGTSNAGNAETVPEMGDYI